MIDFHCDNCEFLQDKSNDNLIDGYCKKYNQSLTFYDWFEKCDKCLIETLQSENAALRERLEKAVEVPSIERRFFGTKPLYAVIYRNRNGYVHTEIFCKRAEAEDYLAELKGEKG